MPHIDMRENEDGEWIASSPDFPDLTWLDATRERAHDGYAALLAKIIRAEDGPRGSDGLTDRERAHLAARYETTAAHRYTSKRIRRAIAAHFAAKNRPTTNES